MLALVIVRSPAVGSNSLPVELFIEKEEMLTVWRFALLFSILPKKSTELPEMVNELAPLLKIQFRQSSKAV